MSPPSVKSTAGARYAAYVARQNSYSRISQQASLQSTSKSLTSSKTLTNRPSTSIVAPISKPTTAMTSVQIKQIAAKYASKRRSSFDNLPAAKKAKPTPGVSQKQLYSTGSMVHAQKLVSKTKPLHDASVRPVPQRQAAEEPITQWSQHQHTSVNSIHPISQQSQSTGASAPHGTGYLDQNDSKPFPEASVRKRSHSVSQYQSIEEPKASIMQQLLNKRRHPSVDSISQLEPHKSASGPSDTGSIDHSNMQGGSKPFLFPEGSPRKKSLSVPWRQSVQESNASMIQLSQYRRTSVDSIHQFSQPRLPVSVDQNGSKQFSLPEGSLKKKPHSITRRQSTEEANASIMQPSQHRHSSVDSISQPRRRVSISAAHGTGPIDQNGSKPCSLPEETVRKKPLLVPRRLSLEETNASVMCPIQHRRTSVDSVHPILQSRRNVGTSKPGGTGSVVQNGALLTEPSSEESVRKKACSLPQRQSIDEPNASIRRSQHQQTSVDSVSQPGQCIGTSAVRGNAIHGKQKGSKRDLGSSNKKCPKAIHLHLKP